MPKTQLSKQCANPDCGKVFFKKTNTPMSEWEKQTKYCSRACYWSEKTTHRCPVCTKKFVSTGGSRQSHCSKICSGVARRKPLPRCEWCGEVCKKLGRRFCKPECKIAWYQGDNVYNYAGGQSRDHYRSAFWLKRAQEIRERDKVCQRCGKTPEEQGYALHVHHITPWGLTHDDSPENLTALCNQCHATVDDEWKKENAQNYKSPHRKRKRARAKEVENTQLSE